MEISLKKIENLLKNSLDIQLIECVDESELHKNHRAMQFSTQALTHVYIRVQSRSLDGLSRVDQHRKIHSILQPVFDAGLHALRLKVLHGIN